MRFSLLGPLEVRDDQDHPVRIGEGRQRSVLVLLLLHRNERIASEWLVDALWGEAPPATAPKILQNHVAQLRRGLGDREGRRLQTHGRAYALRVEPGELDVERFEQLVGEGAAALEHDRPAEAAARLREGLALWRGPPLADVAYEDFAQPEIAGLEEQRAVALERRIDADLALGRHADLLGELEALVSRHPLREHVRGQRILALYRCGRQADALEAFREARRLLVEEVGVEPGAELRDLHDAILRQDASLDLGPGRLPPELDAATAPALAGREPEMEVLRGHWERARDGVSALVVITGRAGMGKTRLAAELAGDVHRSGGAVRFATGEATPATLATIRAGCDATRPTLLVVDDADRSERTLAALGDLARAPNLGPLLTVATAGAPQAAQAIGADDVLALDPLRADAVAAIARGYAPGNADGPVPAGELLERSRGVPGRVHDVASEWARSDARRRVTSFAPRTVAGRSELRTAEAGLIGGVLDLQAAAERAGRADVHEPQVCPFKGLAAFDVADARYFFGRERLVAELVARSVGASLLGVVGPSGSGKSSVVRAGLLAALAGGVLPGSETWRQAIVRPGEHPLGEPHGMSFDRVARERGVLAVDQFEEVFTACRDEGERAAFIDALVRTARDGQTLVVLALRADFYGRCAAYPDLSGLLGAGHVLVGPMPRDALRRAVELPARRARLHVEPELVEALVVDVEHEPGGLPLLSTALLELWQRREGSVLRHTAYELTGGVEGAVARLAEDAYGRLEPAQQPVARTLLLRLAGEGPDGSVVRRRVTLAELDSPGDPNVGRVLEVLTERRLLTASATTVEVAHEALLREWPRLRGWLEQDAQGRRIHRRLTDSARDWDERGRDPADLYRAARLETAQEWRERHRGELNATERAFLDESRSAAGRAVRRLRVALAGVAALLALAVIGALVAINQRGTARTQARIADGQRISQQALADDDLARSLLLARQGFALADSPITRGDLLAALLRRPAAIAVMRHEPGPVTALDLSPDGRTLAVGRAQSGVEFIDTATRRRIGVPVLADRTSITSLRYSPDGARVAVGSSGGQGDPHVTLLDARTHRRRELSLQLVPVFLGALGTIAFSPDSRVVAADYSGVPQVPRKRRLIARWDARTGRALTLQPIGSSPDTPHALGGFITGGTRVVTSSGGPRGTVIRDARTLRPLRRFRAGGSIGDLSTDGRYAVLHTSAGATDVLDLRTGGSRRLAGPRDPRIDAARFTPDSRLLVTDDGAGRLLVWDTARAAPLATVDPRAGLVHRIAVSADGRTAYTAGDDGNVIAWDLAGGRRLGRPFVLRAQAATDIAALSPTSRTFVVAVDGGGPVELLDSRSLAPTGSVALAASPGAAVRGALVASARDGQMAIGTADGAVRFADARSGRPRGPPRIAHSQAVIALAMSPDGRWLATSGGEPAIYAWDVAHQRPVALNIALAGPAVGLSVSPDGTRLAAAVVHPDGTGELDVLSLPRLKVLTRVFPRAGTQTQFSRDGRQLFYADDIGRVWTYDTRTWRRFGPPLGGQSGAGRFSLSPDDRLLAITAHDGTTQLWDVPSRHALGEPLPTVQGHGVRTAFVDGGRSLVTLDRAGRGYVWDVRPQSWAHRACAVAGRTLTPPEWQDALPDRPYTPECGRR